MSKHLNRKTAKELPQAALAQHTLLLNNDYTRITQWVFAPGDQSGWHQHECDYVTVQQSQGTLLLQGLNGKETHVNYEAGNTVAWTAPIEHNAINISNVEIKVLEIEYKNK